MALCLATLLSSACATVTTVPLGPALPTRSGAPVNVCEHKSFTSLRPTAVYAAASHVEPRVYVDVIRHVDERASGIGVYAGASDELGELPEALASIDQDLFRAHDARIAPIRQKLAAHSGFMAASWIGLAVMLAGLPVAASSTTDDRADHGQLALGLGIAAVGAVASLVGAFGVLVTQPTAQEKVDYEIRKRILVPGEDDIERATEAVDGNNQLARQQCRLTPAAEYTRARLPEVRSMWGD